MLSPLDALHAWAVLVNVTETSEMSDVPETRRHDTTRHDTTVDCQRWNLSQASRRDGSPAKKDGQPPWSRVKGPWVTHWIQWGTSVWGETDSVLASVLAVILSAPTTSQITNKHSKPNIMMN